MSNSTLSGIERQLVLQYLMDGNVPVVVTPVVESSLTHMMPDAAVFPIAIRPDTMKVLEEGIILLQNPPHSVSQLRDKMVKVEFYFNRLGLSFTTIVKRVSSGLALVVPKEISHIKEAAERKSVGFEVSVFYTVKNQAAVALDCKPGKGYNLFSKPSWSDIDQDHMEEAKRYLESIILQGEKDSITPNGVYVIPICRYVTEPDVRIKNIEGRFEPFDVLYVNHEYIVFGCASGNTLLTVAADYPVTLSIPLSDKPFIGKRTIFTTCKVVKIFASVTEKKEAVLCSFVSIKEEDKRFLYELTEKDLFD
nr:hypothetical protein [Treponema sp.]